MKDELDMTKSFLVWQAIKGSRKGSRARDAKRPVSFQLLLRLCDKLKTS